MLQVKFKCVNLMDKTFSHRLYKISEALSVTDVAKKVLMFPELKMFVVCNQHDIHALLHRTNLNKIIQNIKMSYIKTSLNPNYLIFKVVFIYLRLSKQIARVDA